MARLQDKILARILLTMMMIAMMLMRMRMSNEVVRKRCG
jgi:hypothetical protein